MALNARRSTGTDADLIAYFKNYAIKNEAKSREEGRPIFDDVEMCEIRRPGARDWQPYPAHVRSHWGVDPLTGGQTEVTYAQRFPEQYRQFKMKAVQTLAGTPIDMAPFLTEARRAELRAFNIITVEQLAHVDGQELKNLGPGGRELKNQAEDYIAESKQLVPAIQLQAELEALRARNMVLEADNSALKTVRSVDDASQFDEMSNLQIKDYLEKETGNRPVGNPSRKTLVRMASEILARPDPYSKEVV